MAHIIVVGNEKGGSGKSTTCMHVATALARMGHRVGALDLDLRQNSFGRYIENRHAYLARTGLDLPVARLPRPARGRRARRLAPNENVYRPAACRPPSRGWSRTSDFIIIDCPGSPYTAEPGRAFAGRHAHHAAERQFHRFRPSGAGRPGNRAGQRPLDLFRNGLERAAAAGAGRIEADRLDRAAQSARRAADAQQDEGRHGAGTICRGGSDFAWRPVFPNG